MSYIGYVPAAKPLTSADITDGIITNADIASGAAIAQSKIAGSFGKVLQVVTATDTTQRTTTSSSFVTASNTLSVTLTPSSTSNKVFLICTATFYLTGGANGAMTFYRDSTNLGETTWGIGRLYTNGTVTVPTTISYLDSPSSTSSLTYQLYFKSDGTSTLYLNETAMKSSITAFEIAG